MNAEQEERFLKCISVNDLTGCWEWAGVHRGGNTIYGHRYGGFAMEPGHYVYAHRAAYEHWRAEIPQGMEVDHLCHNTRCVNPDHLEAVTHQENIRRGRALTTHCPAGHPYDDVNTYVDRDGARRCRQCARDQENARYRALTAEQKRLRAKRGGELQKAKRTTCANGHPLEGPHIFIDARGSRRCTICHPGYLYTPEQRRAQQREYIRKRRRHARLGR